MTRTSAAHKVLDPSLDARSARVAHRFEWPMLVVAVLVIPALALEGSNVGEPWATTASALNWLIWIAFLFEFVVMMSVVPNRRVWLRRHPLELMIVVLTPPFGPAALQGARLLRLLRLLRLARFVVLVRAMFSPEGVKYAALLGFLVVVGGGTAFAAVEHKDTWDGVWWAISTVTTVGYGDVQATTDAGRVIGIVVMVTGIGLVALLTAAAADRFIRREARAELQPVELEIQGQLDSISNRLHAIELLLSTMLEQRTSEDADP